MSRGFILKFAAGLLVAGSLLGSFVLPTMGSRLLLDVQPQSCLPWGLYWATHSTPARWRVGDLVVFDSPKFHAIDPLDRQRKLKMIAALPGDVVSVKDSALWINGHYWGRFWLAKWARTASPSTAAPWFVHSAPVDGAWTVPPGQALLLGTEPLSFDGRYWGFIDLKTIASRAVAL